MSEVKPMVDNLSSKYCEWIEENVPENPLGMSSVITEEMAKEFPELTRVRGHYHDALWGERGHWWLVTTAGIIVDPTKAQFPDQHGEYVAWVEGTKEPTGKCLNCGGYCYDGHDVCSDACARAYTAYLISGGL